MPKNKVQEVIFTVLMVFVMVYAMICYNIAVETGGMTNLVFLHAFRELLIMGPIAFLLDFFLLFKHAGVQIVAVWFETTAKNFPMALLWQLFFAGPLVRFVFRHLMALVQPREKAAVTEKA